MVEITELLPGITLRCCRDTRFKQGCLSLQLQRQMRREEAALTALLPAVLLRGSRLHPDLQSITRHLDTLYGAAVGAQVRRVGDYQTTGFFCGFMEDRFAMPGDRVMEPMFDFVRELLLDPCLEDGVFSREYVEGEKKNLISAIESAKNDKALYATSQLLKMVCREDSFGLPRLGEVPQVAAITPQALYDHWRRILRESPIQLFYVGSAETETVAAGLKKIFTGMERDYRPVGPQTPLKPCPGEKKVELLDVAQGKLGLGYVTPITNRDPRFAAMQVLNIILGAGMTSKLFLNVREKLSLCYSIGSSYYSTKGILLISAGIDFDKEDLTRREIEKQLEACRQGQITAQELESAKQALYSSLRASKDSPGAIESYHATAALSGLAMTVEQYMAAVEQVTLPRVVEAANALTLHSTYFLKGGKA